MLNVKGMVQGLLSPNAGRQQMLESQQMLLSVQNGSLETLYGVIEELINDEQMQIRLVGYNLIKGMVTHRANELNEQHKTQISQLSLGRLEACLSGFGEELDSVKITSIIALTVKFNPSGFLENLVQKLLLVDKGGRNAGIACTQFKFVSEEIVQYREAPTSSEGHRELLSTLMAAVPPILQYAIQVLRVSSDVWVCKRCLECIASYYEWAPFPRLQFEECVAVIAPHLIKSEAATQQSAWELCLALAQKKHEQENIQIVHKCLNDLAKLLAAVFNQLTSSPSENFMLQSAQVISQLLLNHFGRIELEQVQILLSVMQNYSQFLEPMELATTISAFWKLVLAKQKRIKEFAELYPSLMNIYLQHLMKLGPSPNEDAEEEFVDFRVDFRSQIKLIFNVCLQSHPQSTAPILANFASSALNTVLQQSSQQQQQQQIQDPEKQNQLEHAMDCSVFAIEALNLGLIIKLDSQQQQQDESQAQNDGSYQQLVDQIFSQLLQQLMQFESESIVQSEQISKIRLIHARGFESFGIWLGDKQQEGVDQVLARLFGYAFETPLESNGSVPQPFSEPRNAGKVARRRYIHSIGIIVKELKKGDARWFETFFNQVKGMYGAGQLMIGEMHDLLFSIIKSGGTGTEVVMMQILPSIRQDWTQSTELISAFSSPANFISYFLSAQNLQQSQQHQWQAYSTIRTLMAILLEATNSKAPQHVRSYVEQEMGWIVGGTSAVADCIHGLFGCRDKLGQLSGMLDLSQNERQLIITSGKFDVAQASAVVGTRIVQGFDIDALSKWMRNVRESCYLCLQSYLSSIPSFWKSQECYKALFRVSTNSIRSLDNRNLRLIFRHLLIHVQQHCPQEAKETWLAPLALQIFLYAHDLITFGWQQLTTENNNSNFNNQIIQNENIKQAGLGTDEDVIKDTILRELSQEATRFFFFIQQNDLTQWMTTQQQLVEIMTKLALSGVQWPDYKTRQNSLGFCELMVKCCTNNQNVPQQWPHIISHEMIYACIVSLQKEASEHYQAIVIQVLKDIIYFFGDQVDGPYQILAQLVSQEVLEDFKKQFKKAGKSDKIQRRLIKQLLQQQQTGQEFKGLQSMGKSWQVQTVQIPEPSKKIRQKLEKESENSQDNIANLFT